MPKAQQQNNVMTVAELHTAEGKKLQLPRQAQYVQDPSHVASQKVQDDYQLLQPWSSAYAGIAAGYDAGPSRRFQSPGQSDR